jgi:adenine deaminase
MVGDRLLDIVNDVDDVIIESVTIDGTIVEENYMRVIITTKPIKKGKNKSDKKT